MKTNYNCISLEDFPGRQMPLNVLFTHGYVFPWTRTSLLSAPHYKTCFITGGKKKLFWFEFPAWQHLRTLFFKTLIMFNSQMMPNGLKIRNILAPCSFWVMDWKLLQSSTTTNLHMHQDTQGTFKIVENHNRKIQSVGQLQAEVWMIAITATRWVIDSTFTTYLQFSIYSACPFPCSSFRNTTVHYQCNIIAFFVSTFLG